MNDYDSEDFVWDTKAEVWKRADGKPFDSQHPCLLGLIVDEFLDLGTGGTFKILHGHRYVKGHQYPDHIGVYVPSWTISELGINERDRVLMTVFPSGNGAFFTAVYVNKIGI